MYMTAKALSDLLAMAERHDYLGLSESEQNAITRARLTLEGIKIPIEGDTNDS